MENEKIKLTVKIPCNAAVDYAVTADGKAPLSDSVADGVCEYIFDLTQGEHTLKVQSIPKKHNKIGDFRFMFTSGSSKKHYLNHLFAFRYDVHCFTMELSIYVHRDADIKIKPDKRIYANFLNVNGSYLFPEVIEKHNIKITEQQVRIFESEQARKRFYAVPALWYSLCCGGLFALFMFYCINGVIHWKEETGFRGMTYGGEFLMWNFPLLLIVSASYVYYTACLIKRYIDRNEFR